MKYIKIIKRGCYIMTKAIAILIGLVGYTTAVKVLAIIKMMKIRIDNFDEKDFIELLNDPKFRKYMR
jgi:hypothetical protein